LGREAWHVVTSAADEIRDLLAGESGRVVVGVTGPPGVGKSTFARRLADEFNRAEPGFAAFLPMDGFHLSTVQLVRLGRRERKGAPDTFDVAGYVATLTRVARDYGVEDVYVPDFDRAVEEPVAAALVIPRGARLVVTEGNYLALAHGGWAGARSAIDRLYYLDSSAEVRRARLIERHVVGGRTRAEAERWVDVVDEPNAALIAATEADCDRTLRVDDQELL
jgi:pantothenate kinase